MCYFSSFPALPYALASSVQFYQGWHELKYILTLIVNVIRMQFVLSQEHAKRKQTISPFPHVENKVVN